MSEQTFKEKLPKYRRAYAGMRSKRAKTVLLSRLQEEYDCDRKYLIKLLNGQRGYQPRKGRGQTYSKESREMLVKIWVSSGQNSSPYFKKELGKKMNDYEALHKPMSLETKEEILRMSASTMDRIFSRHSYQGLKRGKRNKRSGANRVKELVAEEPGSEREDGQVGILQVDTVALCGGNMGESFFWIASMTDAQTQWVELAPTWNRGAHYTQEALEEMLKRLPFHPRYLHTDNGSEFINWTFLSCMKQNYPKVELGRSRPYKKNDNCRIEQKNGSVVREYFQDIRFDNVEDLGELREICQQISLYTNLFVPCKKLLSKERNPNCKGIKYIRRYDTPKTPLERAEEEMPESEPIRNYREIYNNTNSISLLRTIHRRINQLIKRMRNKEKEIQTEENTPGAADAVVALPQTPGFNALRHLPEGIGQGNQNCPNPPYRSQSQCSGCIPAEPYLLDRTEKECKKGENKASNNTEKIKYL